MSRLKQIANNLINEALLKPFHLKLSFRTGSDPSEDLGLLLRGMTIGVIVDGGAYTGSFSRKIGIVFPEARIYAFEPTLASHALLQENTRGSPAVTCYRLALGASCGQATFYENASPLTNSLHKNSTAGQLYFSDLVSDRSAITVEVTTLADFARDKRIGAIDIVKLDLQGNELEAIVGLGPLIETVKAIHSEVQFVQLYEGTPLFSEVESHLRNKGFELYQLYDLVRSPDDGRLLYGDATFVRAGILSQARRSRISQPT